MLIWYHWQDLQFRPGKTPTRRTKISIEGTKVLVEVEGKSRFTVSAALPTRSLFIETCFDSPPMTALPNLKATKLTRHRA